MSASWLEESWLTLDTETTGVDTDTDRIVTASLMRVPPGATEPDWEWHRIVDPGVDIPPGATAVHGFTTERARAEGAPALFAVTDLVTQLGQHWDPRTPLVVCNAPYDLSLLDAECRRHLGFPLSLRGHVLDPIVIDRKLDKYRKGSRKLDALCAHYGVELTAAHTSQADALAALLVMRRLVEVFPEIRLRTLAEMHQFQKSWRRQWAEEFQEYSRSKARQRGASEEEVREIVIDTDWPIRARAGAGVP